MAIKNRITSLQEETQAAQLLVVTKNRSADEVKEVVAAGVKDIGENKLQEIQEKFDPDLIRELESKETRLHFIGHIQSNKVKKIVRLCDVIQSVDSIKIAQKIDQSAEELDKVMPIFLELNLTSEEQKYGFSTEEIEEAVNAVDELEHLHLEGFMCMGVEGDPAATRLAFKKCRELAQQFELSEVSMGMSQDYQIALEEGSTMLRIGSLIFAD